MMHSMIKQIIIKNGHARPIFFTFRGTLKFSMIGFGQEDEIKENNITALNLVAWCSLPWSGSLY